MKSKLFFFSSFSLFLGLFLSFRAEGATCDLVHTEGRSYATPLLNDSMPPGLPHLAVLKKKDNILAYVRGESGDVKSEEDGQAAKKFSKISVMEVGVDANVIPDWDWGLNFNLFGTSSKQDASGNVPEKKQSLYTAQLNFAGHADWRFFYGLGLGFGSCTDEFSKTDSTSGKKSTMQSLPLALSIGYRINWFFLGAGVSYVPVSIALKPGSDGKDTKENYTTPIYGVGLGWNSGGFRDWQIQLNYAFTLLPEQKKDATVTQRKISRHDVSVEYQKLNVQVGFYARLFDYDKIYPNTQYTESQEILSLGYLPWEGSIFSVQVIANQKTEQYKSTAQDKSNPKYTSNSIGLGLNYGHSFY